MLILHLIRVRGTAIGILRVLEASANADMLSMCTNTAGSIDPGDDI